MMPKAAAAILFALSVILSAPAAAIVEPYTIAEATQLRVSALKCTGGYISLANGESRLTTAAEMIASLPTAADDVAVRPSEERAKQLYFVALGLLSPAIRRTPALLDGKGKFVVCPPDPQAGARLMRYLAGNTERDSVFTYNGKRWLAEAYRQGVGVDKDLAKARQMFFRAAITEDLYLTSADWGANANDQFDNLLKRPWERTQLEEASERGYSRSQLLLAKQILSTKPEEARSLLRKAATVDISSSLIEIADVEETGRYWPTDWAFAATLRGRALSLYGGDGQKEPMLRAARRHNGTSADLPVSVYRPTFKALGGDELLDLAGPLRIARDPAIRGADARALVAPSGQIIFVELYGPYLKQSALMNTAIERVYARSRFPSVRPDVVGGKAVFTWIELPPIPWPREQDSKRKR